jgi:catechol 2,3-dioxygenase-like lactoylglutathione lyase family enzyme
MADAPKVHVHMTVSDLEKSRAFYERFLGVSPVKVKPGYVKFLPAFGPLNLALSEARGGAGGHVDHMGLQVESAEIVQRELARVKAAGLAVREEMAVDCCHANQDKFWVQDPDGVDWEVYVLNYDLEEPAMSTGACGMDAREGVGTAVGGLRVVKAGGCCSSS